MQPTAELRFVKRPLKASEVYAGRSFKYVLQQKWCQTHTMPEIYEWRDVPCVEEE